MDTETKGEFYSWIAEDESASAGDTWSKLQGHMYEFPRDLPLNERSL